MQSLKLIIRAIGIALLIFVFAQQLAGSKQILAQVETAQEPPNGDSNWAVATSVRPAAVSTYYFPLILHGLANPPFAFSGGALYRAAINSDAWYLRGDGQISLGSNGAEQFPLDAELGIESIAAKGDTLFALAEDGIYRRAPDTLQWTQINDLEGDFLAAGASELWITPIDTPNEVWVSTDEVNWESRSISLTGKIVSPVLYNSSYSAGYFVVSEEGGINTLWHANDASGTFVWQKVDAIPGSALNIAHGLFARVVDASNVLGVAVMVGGADGKLYEYRFYNSSLPSDPTSDGWVAVWDFGTNHYPLPLVNSQESPAINEVAVIDQSSGAITLYEGIVIEAGAVPKREWRVKPFPN